MCVCGGGGVLIELGELTNDVRGCSNCVIGVTPVQVGVFWEMRGGGGGGWLT